MGYGVLTMMAFALTIPVAFYFEGPSKVAATWAASTAIVGTPWLIKNIIINGMYYYLYNEVAFLTLNQVAPITHSIANTVKRVAIIVATCIVFRNPMSRIGVIGSSIASRARCRIDLGRDVWHRTPPARYAIGAEVEPEPEQGFANIFLPISAHACFSFLLRGEVVAIPRSLPVFMSIFWPFLLNIAG